VIALADAANVNVDTNTSSPGSTPTASKARCSAAVPLASATACRPCHRRQPGFEPVEVGADGSDPSAVERSEQRFALVGADVRW
jgi:hypothetical protein